MLLFNVAPPHDRKLLVMLRHLRRDESLGTTIVVALHPGTIDTALSRPVQGNVQPGRLFDSERAALQLLDVLEGLKPPDSGNLFEFEGKEIAC